jgi:hypothetical protein
MNKDKLAEYIIDRILKGDVFFLGSEDIVKIQENASNIKFERTDINVKLRRYNKESKLFFIKKDGKLKNYSSDVYIPAGANWETLFGFYFEEDLPIKVHVYYIGREFDLDKLSEMVYSLFTDTGKDNIKIGKISFKYDDDTKVDKKLEDIVIKEITGKKENV